MSPPNPAPSSSASAQAGQAVAAAKSMPAGAPGAAGCKQTSPGPWEPKIVWVKAQGTAYHGPQGKLDLKQLDYDEDKVKLRYAVHGQTQDISLWLQYQPSKVHQDFYTEYQKGDFKPPRIVWFLSDTIHDPGEYELTWDGRDDTPDRRLLLAGKYDLIIEGTVGKETKKDKTTVEIEKPRAVNYGFEYEKYYKADKKWYPESTREAPEDAAKKQGALKDGTAFDASSNCAIEADSALIEMQHAAVASACTHAGPHSLFFYGQVGGHMDKAKVSNLYVGAKLPVEKFGSRPRPKTNGYLVDTSFTALRDMFLMLLNGCCPANEIPRVKFVLNSFDPGNIDGKHGKKTRQALKNFQVVHKIEPADGTKNPETLKWFKLDASKSDKELTTEIQTKLKSYYAGKVEVTDTLDEATSQALFNYQTDHPKLVPLGVLDEETLAALQIGRESDQLRLSRNIADALRNRGADLVLGFIHTIRMDIAVEWSKEFWSQACKGEGIENAAKMAHLMVDRRYQRKCVMKIYAQSGVFRNSKLLPARYGKY